MSSSMPLIRSESWAFIWQPNVVTWYRRIGEQRTARGVGAAARRSRLPSSASADGRRRLRLVAYARVRRQCDRQDDGLREPPAGEVGRSLRCPSEPLDDAGCPSGLRFQREASGSDCLAVDAPAGEVGPYGFVAPAAVRELRCATCREASIVDGSELLEAFQRTLPHARRDAAPSEQVLQLRAGRVAAREHSGGDVERLGPPQLMPEASRPLAVELLADPEARARDRVGRDDAPGTAVELQRNAIAWQRRD